MNFLLGPEASRASCPLTTGSDCISSRPQYTASAPNTLSRPSIVARSPGRPRTVIGERAVPVSVLVKSPLYVPPRTQTVSPGRTVPFPPSNAVDRFQGLLRVPSPVVEPEGAV